MPKHPKKPPQTRCRQSPGEGRPHFSGRRFLYIFRAYQRAAAAQPQSDGLQVNAVLGFCNMLWKLLRDMRR